MFEISSSKCIAGIDEMARKCLAEKLALIPDAVKLVITPERWNLKGTNPETLHVVYDADIDVFVPTMLEILSKRWQTLDLISMMYELKRTLKSKQFLNSLISDSLSSIPTFQKTEEHSP